MIAGRTTLAAMMIASSLSGCTAPPSLNSSLAEPELHQRLAGDFPFGLTVDQVGARLDDARVPRRLRRAYAGPPVQLLARLFPAGGFWVYEPEFEDIRYVD